MQPPLADAIASAAARNRVPPDDVAIIAAQFAAFGASEAHAVEALSHLRIRPFVPRLIL